MKLHPEGMTEAADKILYRVMKERINCIKEMFAQIKDSNKKTTKKQIKTLKNKKKHKKTNTNFKNEKQKKSKNDKTKKKDKNYKDKKNDKMKNKQNVRKAKRRKINITTVLILWLLCWKEDGMILDGRILRDEWKQNWKVEKMNTVLGHSVESQYRNEGTQSNYHNWNVVQCFLVSGERDCSRGQYMSGKLGNKTVKMEHGNGSQRQNISVIHWNMGSRFWTRKKEEVEAVLLQYSPDIFIISESNLLESINDYERAVPGYKILLPKTVEVQDVSRIVMLVREEMEVKIMEEYMDNTIASIWIKVGSKGRRPLLIGAIYREFRYIRQNQEDDSWTLQRQIERWETFVEKWRKAARRNDVMVIGDVNLDYSKWTNPDFGSARMVDKVKDTIETFGIPPDGEW